MRREYKYLVPEARWSWLHERIKPFVAADPYAGGVDVASYVVRSAYLDTPGLRDFHEKEDGILRRRKLRIRGYDQPALDKPVFLEIKQKNEAAVWKDRAPLPAPTVSALLAGGQIQSEVPRGMQEAVGRFLYRLRSEARRPVLLVTYDREPMVGRFDPTLRVTFDRHLRCLPYPVLGADLSGLYQDRGLVPVLAGSFILEVKFDRMFPSWLRPILAEGGFRRQALSKYVMGLRSVASGSPWRFRGGPAVRSLSPMVSAG